MGDDSTEKIPQSMRNYMKADETAHEHLNDKMSEGFNTVRADISEIKSEVKALTFAMSKLVVIEERQSNQLRLSEKNTQAVSDLWKEVGRLRNANTALKVQVAESDGVSQERGKLLWQVVAALTTVSAAILVAILVSE